MQRGEGRRQRTVLGVAASRLRLYGWYEDNSGGRTHPVGEKRPNTFGLYDMHGNVDEWVEDWYGAYPSGPVTDPHGPSTGDGRVNRGGSYTAPTPRMPRGASLLCFACLSMRLYGLSPGENPVTPCGGEGRPACSPEGSAHRAGGYSAAPFAQGVFQSEHLLHAAIITACPDRDLFAHV